eukprot:scaffold257934_cov26-Tisochrysis_lutea.AAC.1
MGAVRVPPAQVMLSDKARWHEGAVPQPRDIRAGARQSDSADHGRHRVTGPLRLTFPLALTPAFPAPLRSHPLSHLPTRAL